MARKNLNRSTDASGGAKSISPQKVWDEEYYDSFAFQMHPANEDVILREGLKLLAYVRDHEDCDSLEYYCDQVRGIDCEDIERWRKKYPKFDRDVKTTMRIIGQRRERAARQFKEHAGTIHFMQAHYDKNWSDQQLRHAALRNKEDNKQHDVEAFKAAVSQLISNS